MTTTAQQVALPSGFVERHSLSKGSSGRRDHLHDRLVEHWGSSIVSGMLTPGSRISTDRAADQFGVSRTVIREAVRVLESMGLLLVRRRLGIAVLGNEHWSPFEPRIIRWRLASGERDNQIRQIWELRTAVEPMAARMAALYATPADCGALIEAVINMTASAKLFAVDQYVENETSFHHVLLRASGNPLLTGLSEVIVQGLVGHTTVSTPSRSLDLKAPRLYGVVVSAIQAGDPDQAEHVMRRIVTSRSTPRGA